MRVTDHHVRRRDAAHALHRAVEAQQLLDRALDEGRIVAQARKLGRVSQQGQHPVADEIRGGLVTGEEEQDDGREQLVSAQAIARFLGGDETGQDVRARRAAPLCYEALEVLVDGGAAALARTITSGSETIMPSRLRAMSADHSRRWSRSSSGTPSISEITLAGSG